MKTTSPAVRRIVSHKRCITWPLCCTPSKLPGVELQLRQAIRSRRPSFWIPVSTFLALIAVGIMILWANRSIPFDSTRWKNEENVRPSMVRDFLDKHDLVGASRDEINTMLGLPNGRDSIRNGKYIYWVGTDGIIDDIWLEIGFENETVVSVRYVPD